MVDYKDVSMFLISENDDMVYINEYDAMDDGDFSFLVLTSDFLNPEYEDDDSIYLYKGWRRKTVKTLLGYADDSTLDVKQREQGKCQFQNTEFSCYNRLLEQIIKSGIKQNDIIIRRAQRYKPSNISIEKYIPVIMMAHHMVIHIKNDKYQGYIPSLVQIMYIQTHLYTINESLKKLCLIEKNFIKNQKYYWTTTEYDTHAIVTVDANNMGGMYYLPKDDYQYVLPIFECKTK